MFEAILDKKLNADRGFIKPKRKPPEELERLKRENFERAAPGLENPDEVKQMLGLAYGGIATPKRGLVDEPGSYGGKIEVDIEKIKKLRDQGFTTKEIANKLKVSTAVIETRVKQANLPKATPFKGFTAERLKFLNEAAKKFGYDSWSDVPVTKQDPNKIRTYGDKEKILQEATRRQKNVPIGKGSPGKKLSSDRIQQIIDTHWSKKPKTEIKKIMESPGYVTRDLNKVKDQMNILKAAQSGKYTTAEEIRKAVGLTKEVFNDKVDKLYTNLYTQIGNMNKKNVKSYVRKEFLPHNLNQLEKIKNQLGKIKGFEAAEQRNIWTQISKAYGQNGETPNRKAFAETMKKAGQYFEVKNALQKKFPNIKLDLDHPLDYKTLEGLGKKGEKFLYVTPINTNVNRGVKEVLGKRYRDAIQVGDKKLMFQIEKLANDIGTTVGKVRGSKVIDYGTTSLRKSDLGSEIISNLKQQNIMADKLSKMTKSGELKTRLGEIGITRPKNYNIQKISDSDIKKASSALKELMSRTGSLADPTLLAKAGYEEFLKPTAKFAGKVLTSKPATVLSNPSTQALLSYNLLKENPSDPFGYAALTGMGASAKLVGDKIKTPFLQKALTLGAGPARVAKLARFTTPFGIAATGVASLVNVAREAQKEFDALSPEEQKEYLAEQEQFAEDVNRDEFLSYAGGGIVGIRRPSAIPPEKGPQSQGLDYLRYYGT